MSEEFEKELDENQITRLYAKYVEQNNQKVISIHASWIICLIEEIYRLRKEKDDLEAAQEWIKYVEGDESTYPKEDGALYDILYSGVFVDGLDNGREFYNFNDGWATDLDVKFYRPLPPAPKEGG